jgi:hypothetical protein
MGGTAPGPETAPGAVFVERAEDWSPRPFLHFSERKTKPKAAMLAALQSTPAPVVFSGQPPGIRKKSQAAVLWRAAMLAHLRQLQGQAAC